MGKKQEKVYKVMRVEAKGLCSIAAPGKYRLYYGQGEVTRALNGAKLFVFKDLDRAVRFARWQLTAQKWQMWEVEAGDEIEPLSRVARIHEAPIMRFWEVLEETGRVSQDVFDTRIAPEGTYTCDWVRPIKRAMLP